MERTIGKTFEYLDKVEYPRDRMELILADGGSTDKTIQMIKDYQAKNPYVKLIEIPDCPSPGYARTQALKQAKGDFIFFTDGDCAPCSDWIYKMLKVFAKDPKIGAVGGEIYTLRVDPQNLYEIYCEAFGFNRVSWRYGNLQEGYYPDFTDKAPTEICGHRAYFFVTANVAYRKEAVDDGERRFWDLPTGEDMDFGFRVREKGWKFYFLPDASVDHMHRADLKALLKVWFSYGAAHPPLLNAHASQYMEIVTQFLGCWPQHKSYKLPFPVKGFIYIGNFQLMHLFGGLFTIFFLLHWLFLGSGWLQFFTWAAFVPFLISLFKFFKPAFNIEPYDRWFDFARIKYLTNLYFIKGAWKGSAKYKTFCIDTSF